MYTFFAADFSDFHPLIDHTVLLSPVNRFRVCVDLTIQGDLDLEGEEEFEVEMTLVSSRLNSVRGESRVRVLIIDNDSKIAIQLCTNFVHHVLVH